MGSSCSKISSGTFEQLEPIKDNDQEVNEQLEPGSCPSSSWNLMIKDNDQEVNEQLEKSSSSWNPTTTILPSVRDPPGPPSHRNWSRPL